MADIVASAPHSTAERRLAFFDRYISLWVALCMAVGS